MLLFGEKPLTLFGPPDERFEDFFNRHGPLRGFVDLRKRVDG